MRNKIDNMTFLVISFALLFLIALGSLDNKLNITDVSYDDEETIKIGVISDFSGDLQSLGSKYGAIMAVNEINSTDGLFGKKVEVIYGDGESKTDKYLSIAEKMIVKDKVNVIFSSGTSASREIIRSICEKNKVLYFYTSDYEGEVVSKYVFCTGAVAEQKIQPLIEYSIDNIGKRIYIVASNDSYGQSLAKWVENTAKNNGGEIIGADFISLHTNDFREIIKKIIKNNPQVLYLNLSGKNQYEFFDQWGQLSHNNGIKLITDKNIDYENMISNKSEGLKGIIGTVNYIKELNNEESEEFLKKYLENKLNLKYIGSECSNMYTSINIWKYAVESMKSVKCEEVIEFLESSDRVFSSPSGKVTMNSDIHHLSRNIFLAEVDDEFNVKIIKEYNEISPNWLKEN